MYVESPSTSQSGGGGAGSGADTPHHESAMHQLLNNISAAAGTNEVLGFGVMPGTTHRNRGEGEMGEGGGEGSRVKEEGKEGRGEGGGDGEGGKWGGGEGGGESGGKRGGEDTLV